MIDGEIWFVGKDITDILAYQNGSRDIERHVDEEDRKILQNYQNGTFEISNRGSIIINVLNFMFVYKFYNAMMSNFILRDIQSNYYNFFLRIKKFNTIHFKKN